MKKILVPVDFTGASRNASEYAVAMAKAFAAEIYLLHVFMESSPVSETPVTWNVEGNILQEECDLRLAKEKSFLEKKYDITVNGDARVGFKGDSIRDIAKEMEADIIVMGMKKIKKNKLLGSTVLTVIRKSETPVIVVPEEVYYKNIKQVVLASDFNEEASTATYNPLLLLLQKYDATLQVLHIQKGNMELTASEMPGKLQLGRVLSKITFWYQEVEAEDTTEAILKFVQNHPADLLVMVAHHHSFFERLFGTSYTRDVSYETTLPLLIL